MPFFSFFFETNYRIFKNFRALSRAGIKPSRQNRRLCRLSESADMRDCDAKGSRPRYSIDRSTAGFSETQDLGALWERWGGKVDVCGHAGEGFGFCEG